MSLLTKANTINTLEGSRLQPRDMLDASQPTHIGHQLYVGAKGEPDGQTKNQTKQQELKEQKSQERGTVQPFILKGHMTHAHAVL